MLEKPSQYDHLYVGTTSWKYDSWKGLIYPDRPNLKEEGYLQYYSQYYNTVEIDQYFWSLFPPQYAKMPDREEVAWYTEQVPEDFRFTLKAPNSITLTHFYKQQSPTYRECAGEENPHGFLNTDLWDQFWWNMEPMHDRIGAVILQFSYLNKSMMSGVTAFLENLDEFLKHVDPAIPIAIESRNPNYLNRRYFEFLKERDIPHVYLSGYYMPSPVEIYRKYGNTGRFTLFRLHGGDRKGIEQQTGGEWNEIVDPHDDELEDLADIAADEIRLERAIYLDINNHYEGSAPLSIERFFELFPRDGNL